MSELEDVKKKSNVSDDGLLNDAIRESIIMN